MANCVRLSLVPGHYKTEQSLLQRVGAHNGEMMRLEGEMSNSRVICIKETQSLVGCD